MPPTRHTFEPYERLLQRISAEAVTKWEDIELDFLEATSSFDGEYAAGGRDTGWYRSKARYFNDFIVELLANASGMQMSTRQKKNSQLFGKLDIDVCYPGDGTPVVGAEVKQLGTPPHPGNRNEGRRSCTDLHKRIREVAFTSVDFKRAYAPPSPINSFQHWIDTTPPGYFTFWSMRVDDDHDFQRVRTMLANLRTYCNGVGAVMFMGTPDNPTTYAAQSVNELDMDRCLQEIAQRVVERH